MSLVKDVTSQAGSLLVVRRSVGNLPHIQGPRPPWIVDYVRESLGPAGVCHKKRIPMPSGTPQVCDQTLVRAASVL